MQRDDTLAIRGDFNGRRVADLIIRGVDRRHFNHAIDCAALFAVDYPDRETGIRHGVGYYDPASGIPPLLVYRTRTAIVVRGQSNDQ